MDGLSRFCCQNSECPDHGQRGAGNLTVCDHYGPNNARRMLRCPERDFPNRKSLCGQMLGQLVGG